MNLNFARIALFALGTITVSTFAFARDVEDAPEPTTQYVTSGPRSYDNWDGTLSGVDAPYFQSRAKKNGVIFETPKFHRSPGTIKSQTRQTLRNADVRIKDIARAEIAEHLSFEATIEALEDILYPVRNLHSRLYLMKEVHPDEKVRKAANDQVQVINDWFVDLMLHEDLYTVCKTFGDAYFQGTRPKLDPESVKLIKETVRDFHRAGAHLEGDKRDELEGLLKKLSSLESDFHNNIREAKVEVMFTADELAGVPESFLAQFEPEDGTYTLQATVITHFIAVMDNATSEATRRKMKEARFGAAQDTNSDVLNEMVVVRNQIADLLGYASWADYQTEIKMARTAHRATAFVADLIQRLEPKFKSEIEELRALKAEDTNDPSARIHIWDWRYYENQLKQRKYDIDAEAMRAYFPLDNCLRGMFGIYEEVFGLKISRVNPSWVWHKDVALYAVSDAASEMPLGLFYLDPFPREGKYGHFAMFDVTHARMGRDNKYRRPVVALVCNFPPPTADQPSLLSHSELRTLFHEFGHAIHAIMTNAQYARFAGTNTPRDFVEAPSQMLEYWIWDAGVLNRFAADYRDPTNKINPSTLARMKEARTATIGLFYRRQLAFALGDLVLHAPGPYKDAQAVFNGSMSGVFLAPPQGSNFAAYFGHMAGYDAGYYGYAWADVIAADMATIFERDREGYISSHNGMRLRNEVLAPGGSRDVEDSIQIFLGRRFNNEAFLRKIGAK